MRENQLPGGSMIYELELIFSENHKTAENLTTTKAGVKISTDLDSL